MASKNHTSPLIPSKQLKKIKLVAVRGIQETIEALVEVGIIKDELSDCWKEMKKEHDLDKANTLYDEGRILDAAKLGLPKAQGEVPEWYYYGSDGVKKDRRKSLEWAIKATEGGDKTGQLIMGFLYKNGIPGVLTSNKSEAISWYTKAVKQGCADSMYLLGCT